MYFNNNNFNNNNNQGFGYRPNAPQQNTGYNNQVNTGYQQPQQGYGYQPQPQPQRGYNGFNQPQYNNQMNGYVQPMYGQNGYNNQAMVQQQAPAYLEYKGFFVDLNWRDDELYKLEDPNYINRSAGLRAFVNRVPDAGAMNTVTKNILRNMVLYPETDKEKVRFKSILNGKESIIDFSLDVNSSTLVRRVYVTKLDANQASYNPLVKTIEGLIDRDITRGVETVTSYGQCFAPIIGITNMTAKDSATYYINAVTSAIDFIISQVTSNKYIRIENGRIILSYTLYDIIENGFVSYAGIKIKPIISLSRGNQPIVTVNLDFTEDITVLFKGDSLYREGITLDTTLQK